MTKIDRSTDPCEPAVADYRKAAEEVVCLLASALSPKKERAVRKALDVTLRRLETSALPTNVVRLRGREHDTDGAEGLRLAVAIRLIAAPVLS